MFGASRSVLPENLNICLISRKFPVIGRSGDYGFLWPLAKALVKKGQNVTILTWKGPEKESRIEVNGLKAIFIGEKTRKTYMEFPNLVLEEFQQLHRVRPFHLVHSLDDSGILIAKRKKEFGIGVVFDVEATQMPQLFSILGLAQDTVSSMIRTSLSVGYKFLISYLTRDRQILNYADSVFVTTPEQRHGLERYYLFPDHRTYTIPYGIDVTDLSPKEKSAELIAKLGIPPSAHIVVSATDMTEFLEAQNILRAFEKVVIKKPNCRLLIVGEGPLQKKIEYEMLSLVLGNKVIFVGAVSASKLADYVALADVFVDLSSRTSGYEPTLLEAMAQKKVIIGSEVSPIATIVEDGVDGFLIRPADQKTLASILLGIFNQEIPTQSIGEQARQKIVNLFDMEKMVQQTVNAYSRTLLTSGLFRRQARRNVQLLPN